VKIPVPEGVQVLDPDGSLQDIELLEIQTNRSTAVLPSIAEDDKLYVPIFVP
jgi:hypothetical protein